MKIAYGIFGIAAVVAALTAGYFGMPDVMYVSTFLATVLLLAANSDRIAKIKASATGFEAETRAIINEARATIEELRAIAKIAVRANLSLVMRGNRWGGFSQDEKEEVRRLSLAALTQIGVPAPEQEEMFLEWHSVVRYDHVYFLLGRHTVPKQVIGNVELHTEWGALRNVSFDRVPTADTVDAFLRKAGMLDDERKELLEDYRFYEANRRHRRPEVWKALVDRDR
jgi:hypothetical protein